MMQDLTFALLFDYPGGHLAALEILSASFLDAKKMHGSLAYKENVLKFEKNPVGEEEGELQFQISVFPLNKCSLTHQRALLQEIRAALSSFVGDVDVLAEDELLHS